MRRTDPVRLAMERLNPANHYFDTVVFEAIHKLEMIGSAVVFTAEQRDFIFDYYKKQNLPLPQCKCDEDGFYHLIKR